MSKLGILGATSNFCATKNAGPFSNLRGGFKIVSMGKRDANNTKSTTHSVIDIHIHTELKKNKKQDQDGKAQLLESKMLCFETNGRGPHERHT